MIKFHAGILDKSRLLTNILLVILLAGNLFFSIQYVYFIKFDVDARPVADCSLQDIMRIRDADFLKLFLNKVVKTKGVMSSYDRMRIEDGIQQINNPNLTAQWNIIVSQKSPDESMKAATNMILILGEGSTK